MKVALLILALAVSPLVAAEPARWNIDYSSSRIAFTAEQAEAPFDGSFKTFEADVYFDPAALAESRADVQIDTASVATSDKERDGILRGAGWFESEQFPRAHFVAKTFAKAGDGYEARGELTIRSVTLPVVFRFTLKDAVGRIELKGEAELDRLAFQMGLGDWADPKWIGKTVQVHVTLIGSR